MKRAVLIAAAALLAGSCAVNDAFPAPSRIETAAPAPGPYLGEQTLTALAQAVQGPPAPGSAEAAADHAASQRWRAFEDSDRWRLAQAHAEVRPNLAVQHFDCPLNTRLAEEPPPALMHLLGRSLRDASVASNAAKAVGFRNRPIVDDPDRRACIRVDDDLRSSASYPSGHATVGALWGRIMAEVAPDQAQTLTRIGDEIGVSRAVCALHYPSDVAAGQALGVALFQAVRETPEYQADLAAARAEVARARSLGLRNPGCAAERAALGQTPS
ncbi:MAG: acid phosphatase (class A) [Brevundimonas sp.]|jgi:acid phosphatase (class A)|uniref:phosphatase PAP2 family protein n=1 Tax=Brevundimonas sp. TaxID=1871086 RepID=UPI0039E25480